MIINTKFNVGDTVYRIFRGLKKDTCSSQKDHWYVDPEPAKVLLIKAVVSESSCVKTYSLDIPRGYTAMGNTLFTNFGDAQAEALHRNDALRANDKKRG